MAKSISVCTHKVYCQFMQYFHWLFTIKYFAIDLSTLNDAPNQSITLHFFFGYLVLFFKILFLLPLGLLFLITLDMMVLKNLLAHAEGHRNSRHSKCVLKEALNLKCVLSFCKTIFKLIDMLQPIKKELNHS